MTKLTLTYDTTNNIKLDLYLPKTEAPPLFIYMHGGGLEGGDRTDPHELFERLIHDGIAVATLDYRMYPSAKFPEFIEDAAKAIDFILHNNTYRFSKIYAGGSSAGAYLAMMLLFDNRYLAKYNIDPLDFDGWVLDAGQPTTHFNVLRERGLDTRLVRIDDAAPLYHITHSFKPTHPDGKLPMILNIAASNDMPARLEQLKLLNAVLKQFGWQTDRLHFAYMNGYSHCEYDHSPIFAELIESIIK
ncbi:MAG: alpha/beta hydrolase [Clostridiales bacterium]|nr:alpha/beta hydrolase [Clostridiales bacterium]